MGISRDGLSLFLDIRGAPMAGWWAHRTCAAPGVSPSTWSAPGRVAERTGSIWEPQADLWSLSLQTSSRWVAAPGSWAEADCPFWPHLRVMQSFLPHSMGHEQVMKPVCVYKRGKQTPPLCWGHSREVACRSMWADGRHWGSIFGNTALKAHAFASILCKIFPPHTHNKALSQEGFQISRGVHPRMSSGPVRGHRHSGESTGPREGMWIHATRPPSAPGSLFKRTGIGVPIMVQWKRIWLVLMRT